MGKIKNDAYEYSSTVVVVFGILGNILVILSILRQKKNMLKNDYYFLVLHLAICDLAALIILIFNIVDIFWLEEPLPYQSSMITCNIYVPYDAFKLIGVGLMMLIISLLRYRATVHPLKPAISRRKLKVVSGLVYLVGLIVGGGIRLPRCFVKSNVVVSYKKFFYAFWMFFGYVVPTISLAVVYYKISRSFIKQNKYIKRVGSNEIRPAPDSFNILRYIRNRRTFRVCLSVVLCYGIAHIPISVWYMWCSSLVNIISK